MRIRLNPRGRFAEFKVDDDFVITREWQECSEDQAIPLLGSEYKGLPLVEVDDVEAREAEIEMTPEDEFDEAEQEGESYGEN